MSIGTKQRREDIINQPIGKQLYKLTMPMVLALFAFMGLGIVDSYFIGFLGFIELASIGFIVPVTTFANGIALGFGMAVSSLTSRLIGANKLGKAAHLITDGFYLVTLISIAVTLLLYAGLDTIFKLIGACDRTQPVIHEYMTVWLIGTPFLMLSLVGSSTLRAIGDTATSAKIALIMTVTNILLDPLLIFGWGPIPALGMKGAAWATVLSVLLACFFGLYQLAFKDRFILFQFPKWQPFKAHSRQLLHIGIPSMLANLMVPLIAAVLTLIVAQQGPKAVAAFGVGTRIEAFSLSIIYALSATLPMFIGQNLGANKSLRARQALSLSFKFTLLLQGAIWLILALFNNTIAEQFSTDEEVRSILETFLLIVPISYGLSGVIILINVSLNVLNKPRVALYINIIRLCCFYIPLTYLGSLWYGTNGIFISIAFANLCASLLAYYLLQRIMRPLFTY